MSDYRWVAQDTMTVVCGASGTPRPTKSESDWSRPAAPELKAVENALNLAPFGSARKFSDLLEDRNAGRTGPVEGAEQGVDRCDLNIGVNSGAIAALSTARPYLNIGDRLGVSAGSE